MALSRLRKLAIWILGGEVPGGLDLAIGPVTEGSNGSIGGGEVELTLLEGQRVLVTAKPKSLSGRQARIDGAVQFSTNDPASLQITPGPDPATQAYLAPTPLGLDPRRTVNVRVTADADLGEGVEELVSSLDVVILPQKAAILELELGQPEEVAVESSA